MAQIDLLRERIPNEFDDEELYNRILNQLLEDTKNIALANLYPFKDWSLIDLPRKYYNWQLRACVEIKNLLGLQGLKSYSENGLSFTRMSDGLSLALMEELISEAGTIKKKVINNLVKIYIKKDDELWSSSGINVALYKNSQEAYSYSNATLGDTFIAFSKVENGTYQIYASIDDKTKEDIVYTGVDIYVFNNEVTRLIDYYSLTPKQGTGTTLSVKYEDSEGTEISTKTAILKNFSIYISATLEPNYKDLVLLKNGLPVGNPSTFEIYEETTISSSATEDV